jgi:hypothetical protein
MAYGAALAAFFVLGGFLVACVLLKLATLWFPEPLLYVTQAKDGRFGRLGPDVVFLALVGIECLLATALYHWKN